MDDQKYLEFLKMLEGELLSYRWGCVFDAEKKVALAEFGNLPSGNNNSIAKECNTVFEEALKSNTACNELMTQDEQWIMLMRKFSQKPLLCFVLFRSGGVTTAWARDTLKQKIEEFNNN